MTAQKQNPRRVSGAPRAESKTYGPHSNSAAAQRQRIEARLRNGASATTIQLRREEDVMMPAARIHELRHQYGLNIVLNWIDAATECGRKHRVGLYTLRSGKFPDVATRKRNPDKSSARDSAQQVSA